VVFHMPPREKSTLPSQAAASTRISLNH
jgi:hypothetical protein